MDSSIIIDFWFGVNDRFDPLYMHNPRLWWGASEAVDHEIKSKFGDITEQAYSIVKANNNSIPLSGGEPFSSWRNTPSGCIALILLLDQFPRNIYRGTHKAFATDEAALNIVSVFVTQI